MTSLEWNIVLGISKILNMPDASTIYDIRDKLYHNRKRVVFLIDEADKFIQHEKEVDFEVTKVFKKLSDDGKVTFVLAGFWELYFYVTSD